MKTNVVWELTAISIRLVQILLVAISVRAMRDLPETDSFVKVNEQDGLHFETILAFVTATFRKIVEVF